MKIRRTTHSTRHVIAVTLVCASTLFGSSGCFGSFWTLSRLYHWNSTVEENKFARWGIFVATMVVPIYPSAAIFDMIFTNTVEFWTGRNPMAANDGTTRMVHTEDGEDVSMSLRDDGAVDVAIRAPSKPDLHLIVRPEGDSLAAYDDQGRLVARGVQVLEAAR
jgi:hypothetical protein